MGLSLRLPTAWQPTSPRSCCLRESMCKHGPKWRPQSLYLYSNSHTISDHHHFCHILFITSESLTPAHPPGQGIHLHLWKGEVSKNLWTYFWNHWNKYFGVMCVLKGSLWYLSYMTYSLKDKKFTNDLYINLWVSSFVWNKIVTGGFRSGFLRNRVFFLLGNVVVCSFSQSTW